MSSHHESSVADRDSAEIARRSYRAYLDKDRSAIERLIAEDFHFTRVSVLIKRFLASKCDLPLGGHLRGRQAFA
jgi:hypothetical protein